MLHYTSLLGPEYRADLERLLFFNPGQQSALAAIVDAVERFGSPSLHEDNGHLRVRVNKLDDVQTLYALDDDTLAGVLIYSRTSSESLAVIHIAVEHQYSSHGRFAHHLLAVRMIELLRRNARRIKGINSIHILYSGHRIRHFPV